MRTLIGSAMNTADTGGYKRDVRDLRKVLGDAAFSAEWEAGATLDIEEMVAQVGGCDAADGSLPTAPSQPGMASIGYSCASARSRSDS